MAASRCPHVRVLGGVSGTECQSQRSQAAGEVASARGIPSAHKRHRAPLPSFFPTTTPATDFQPPSPVLLKDTMGKGVSPSLNFIAHGHHLRYRIWEPAKDMTHRPFTRWFSFLRNFWQQGHNGRGPGAARLQGVCYSQMAIRYHKAASLRWYVRCACSERFPPV